MPLSAGSRLGAYEILSPLGAGGMGEVYRARDPRLGRDVAIKVLPEEVSGDPERLARFEREARALAALNHPGIVTIFAVEEAGGARFLAMELVEGESLDALLAPGGLPLPRFLEIAIPLAEALSAAHERGIVHRDLKPGNVMVTREGRVKVLDFGLAKAGAAESGADVTSTPTESRVADLTSEGQVFGTVAYMSPEQARGARVDARSDVFSLGVVLYQMLTGDRPFRGESAIDVMSAILRDTPASVTDLRADLPAHLGRVLRRCLEKEPRDRYQTSRDVYNELKDLRAEASAPSARPHAPAARSAGPAAQTQAQAFRVAVLPFLRSEGDAELDSFAEGLAEDINAGLAKFPYLSVISRSSVLRVQSQTPDVRDLGEQLGARYVLEGGIRKGASALRVNVRLVDVRTGAQLWAETYDRDLASADVLAVQDDVTDRVVATVADTSGALVRSMAAGVEEKPDAELTAFDCVLRHCRYQQRGTPQEHARVREGLERFVEREPGHAEVWACLARLYVHEFAFGFNRRPEPLERALNAAQRSVDLDPTGQHARNVIAQVFFFRRNVRDFRTAAEHAIALNPRDTDTLGVMGNLFADSGDFERGPSLARRAMELNPHAPEWHRFALVCERFHREDYEGALDQIARVNMPGFFWKPLWAAACCGLLERQAEGAAAVAELRRLDPDIPRHVRPFVENWLYASGLGERLLDGLRKAGLDVPETAERGAPPGPPSGVSSGAAGPKKRSPWIAVAAAALVLVAAGVWIARSRRAPAPPPEAAHAPHPIRSVAVLPLDNYSGDPSQDYFAEGMTDELTSQLAILSGLRVISRGSAMQFAGKNRPPTPEIAKKLDVDAVVEGSVIRSGDKVRITAQLIDARSDRHLWSKSFERSSKDVLALQDELASAIAQEIDVKLTPAEESRRAKGRSVNPDAYDAYLKGRYWFNRPTDENLQKAIALFEEATTKDSTYAPAFSGLSDALLWAGYNEGVLTGTEARPKARAAAEKAIALDADSAEAHTSLATFKIWYEYDWTGAEAEYRRAFALNPNYAFAHDQFGIGLAFQGRFDEAIAEGKRAAALDPLSPQIPLDAAMAFGLKRDLEGGRKLARRAAELDPTLFFAPFVEGWLDIQEGKLADAIRNLRKAKEMESPAFVSAWLAYAYGASGDRTRAAAEAADLKKRSLRGEVTAFNQAMVALGRGDRSRAVELLEWAYATDSQWLGWLDLDKAFDPLRSEPRFQALLKKLNFSS